MFLWGFWNTWNWRFFDFVTFEIPEISQVFDYVFFKCLELTIFKKIKEPRNTSQNTFYMSKTFNYNGAVLVM
jgi:hypothetical protein